MIIRKSSLVEAEKADEGGAAGVGVKVLLGEPEGAPNFVLRRFYIEPEGHSPRHSHEWEHEVYVLAGSGTVFAGGKELPLEPGDAVLVPPGEEHQFTAGGDEPFEFLCIIPRR